MKIEAISYEEVREKIKQMLEVGEKINIRNVRMRTGGKSATIMDFVKRWHNEQMLNIHDDNFSDDLKKAIIFEKNSAVDKAVETYKTQIVQLTNTLKEAQDLLADEELANNKLKAELEQSKSAASIDNAKLSLKIEGLEKLQTELKEQLAILHGKIEE